MNNTDTLLLKRNDVAGLLTIDQCIAAVEQVFRLYAEGKTMPPKALGIHVDNGGFHIKAGILGLKDTYFVAKANANFPGNPKQNGLPTIQGILVVNDASNGRLLSLMDSAEITIIRTGAATAIAAKYLSLPDSNIATICGCGNQGRVSLRALMRVRKLKKVYAYDIDRIQVQSFIQEFLTELDIVEVSGSGLGNALRQSQICVTCTPSKQPYIHPGHIMPGTFIAAVGADSEEKQELFPELLSSNKVVVDIIEQSASIGELHHAIEKGLMTIDDVHAELGMIIAGKKPGRESDEEIIIFDSTGTGLQDVASAAIVYEKAVSQNVGTRLNFSQQ